MNFQPGDLVKLKSGGPTMTVTKEVRGRISVTWFDKDNNDQYRDFDPVVLEKVEKP